MTDDFWASLVAAATLGFLFLIISVAPQQRAFANITAHK